MIICVLAKTYTTEIYSYISKQQKKNNLQTSTNISQKNKCNCTKILTRAYHEVLDKFIETSNYLRRTYDKFESFKQGFILRAELMSELYTDDV